MSRVSSILSRVRLNLGNVGVRDLKDPTIYKQMQEAQRQIILDTRCLEIELQFTTIAGQAVYGLSTIPGSGGLATNLLTITVGNTASRPTSYGASDAGLRGHWDTTIKSLVIWTGTEWSDEDEP